MIRPLIAMMSSFALLLGACGDDSSENPSGSGSTTNSGSTTEDSSVDTTTTTASSDPSSGGGSSSTGTPADSSGTDTEGETDTAGIDCDAIAPGPLAVEMVFAPGEPFDGAEDIAFDGQGNVAGEAGNEVLLVAADGSTVDSWPDPGPAWGLRFRGNGDLLAAKFTLGEIHVVNDGGSVLVGSLASINGLFPDFDDNLWFTDGDTVQRYNEADGSTDILASGGDAFGSNGVVWDPDRGLLFFTVYGGAQVRSIEIGGDGSPGTISTLATIGNFGSAVDGLSMDACGNLYAVDQANSALYRLFVDESGAVMGEPELLIASFPTNVANAVFGVGPGWDPESVYASGAPGGVYRVEIGVPGAPYPTP